MKGWRIQPSQPSIIQFPLGVNSKYTSRRRRSVSEEAGKNGNLGPSLSTAFVLNTYVVSICNMYPMGVTTFAVRSFRRVGIQNWFLKWC